MTFTDKVSNVLELQLVGYINFRMQITKLFYNIRLSKETLRFRDDIDSVEFICRELWNFIYKKQVDNLRTNHSVRPKFN